MRGSLVDQRRVFVFLVLQLVAMRGRIGFPFVRCVVQVLRRVLAYVAALLPLMPAVFPANRQLAHCASEIGVELLASLALGKLVNYTAARVRGNMPKTQGSP